MEFSLYLVSLGVWLVVFAIPYMVIAYIKQAGAADGSAAAKSATMLRLDWSVLLALSLLHLGVQATVFRGYLENPMTGWMFRPELPPEEAILNVLRADAFALWIALPVLLMISVRLTTGGKRIEWTDLIIAPSVVPIAYILLLIALAIAIPPDWVSFRVHAQTTGGWESIRHDWLNLYALPCIAVACALRVRRDRNNPLAPDRIEAVRGETLRA